jgi:hypothetical protein
MNWLTLGAEPDSLQARLIALAVALAVVWIVRWIF